jgi:CheY-like chemotaxis protein
MSFDLPSDRFAVLRDHVQSLVSQARAHEDYLKTLVREAEADILSAEAALSGTYHRDDDVWHLLCARAEDAQERAQRARQLCISARHGHVAARRLLVDLDPGCGPDELVFDRRPHAVLVVDDSEDVRELVAQILENSGFVVRVAANGLEGLIAAYEMRPGVIVMDVAMPVLNGIEATRLIKSFEPTRAAQVIAYTGNASIDRLGEQPFAAVLQKPATPDVVVATVQRVAGA